VRYGIALIIVLGACRLRFDETPRDAPSDGVPDGPLHLTCNVGTQIGIAEPASNKLAATGTITGIFASWIQGSGQLVGLRAELLPADVIIPRGRRESPTAVWDRIACASDGNVSLGVAQESGSTMSFVQPYDEQTLAPLTNGSLVDNILAGAHGVVATGVSPNRYLVAGRSPVGPGIGVLGIAADGTVSGGPAIVAGFQDGVSIVAVASRFAVVMANGGTCSIRSFDAALQTLGLAATWGTAAQCNEPLAVYSPGRTDVLFVRHDTVDDDLNHVIGQISGTTFSIPGEGRLATTANTPQGIGVANEYWVTYQRLGMLEAVRVTFAGVADPAKVLGPLADPTGHDVVVQNGEPYAVWVDSGAVQVAHLCP
jgi:hypothetical protein